MNYFRELWLSNEFSKQAIKFSEVGLKRTASGPRVWFIHFLPEKIVLQLASFSDLIWNLVSFS